MKTQAMKRSVLALATALFAVSTCAFAQVTKAPVLTDAQLDQVTAGGAVSTLYVFNNGKANVMQPNRNHGTCINCVQISTLPAGTSGVVSVSTPSKELPVQQVIRAKPFNF